jgi:hypothetical protein
MNRTNNWAPFLSVLMVYMGVMYMYIDGAYGCYIQVY